MYQKAYPPNNFPLLCTALATFNTLLRAINISTTTLPSIHTNSGYGRLIFKSILLSQPILFTTFVAVIIIAS